MSPSRQLAIGFVMTIAGLAAVEVGVLVASHDLIVGLILLLIVPLSVSFCGVVVTLIGLVRLPDGRNRFSLNRKIIGVGALAGSGYAFGFSALGSLSQLPDYFAGLNGAFQPDAGLAVFLFVGASLLVGLGLGVLVALIWRKAGGRQVPSAAEVSGHR
jgi:hypothetical protein